MINNKILMIVDDDEDDRSFFIEAISEMGTNYNCYSAENGIDALNQLNSANPLPDYIFLDVNMPVMNGSECLKELKNDPRLQNIPVVIYSSSSYKQSVDFTIEHGVAHYLTKVYDLSKLPEAIFDAIKTIESKIYLE
jgi:CheY-like chemotaxis protein